VAVRGSRVDHLGRSGEDSAVSGGEPSGSQRGPRPVRRPGRGCWLVADLLGPWRTGRTASGSFEGVLGFGGNAPQERNISGGAAEGPEPKEVDKEPPSSSSRVGGGPGWGTGQKKWRIAAGLTAAPETEKVSSTPSWPRGRHSYPASDHQHARAKLRVHFRVGRRICFCNTCAGTGRPGRRSTAIRICAD
jgi:PERQ amino acid-rich with GYF domain-containing protein